MKDFLKRLMVEEEGQGIVEYTLMIGLVAVGIYTAVNSAGLQAALTTGWGSVATSVGTATS